MEIPVKLLDEHKAILISIKSLGKTNLRELDTLLRTSSVFSDFESKVPQNADKFFSAVQSLNITDKNLSKNWRPVQTSALYQAWSTISHSEELVRQLIFLGLIKNYGTDLFGRTVLNYEDDLKLTTEGENIADRIFEGRRIILRPPRSDRKTVFIACAFGKKIIDELCDKYFIPSIENLGYSAFRVDRSEPPATITETMLKKIRESVAVIADLTYARQSVYFEAGYAHAWGVPLLLTCNKKHLNGVNDSRKIHFDLAQYKISFWMKDKPSKYIWETGNDEIKKRLKQLISKK